MTEKIFITGGTGFLGGAIAAEMILQGRIDETLLLIRAETITDARHRIIKQLNKFEIPHLEQLIKPRHIVLGDLDNDEWTQHPSAKNITKIINCAAIASFGNNPNIWRVNVDETFKFARAASKLSKLKRFMHVGTGMACGIQASSPVEETYNALPSQSLHLVPYTQSKAEIERKISEELPHLPLVVARPSIIVGHTLLGVKPSPSIFWVFRMGSILREFLCNYDDRIDVIPVDWAAKSILALTDKCNLKHQRYHISAGPSRSCTFREIDNKMTKFEGLQEGTPYKKVSFEDLYERRNEFPDLFGPMEDRIILKAMKLYGGFSLLNFMFENQNLREEGIELPPLFIDYIDNCLSSSEQSSISEQMMIDFK